MKSANVVMEKALNKVVKIVLVGIGGYGETYVRELLDNRNDDLFTVIGIVDPYAEKCSRLNEFLDMGVKVYKSLGDFYDEESAELAVISSPIHLHCRQTCVCLEHGTNVLCEKPLAGSLEDGLAMRRAEQESGCFVAIGYQWSFSEAIQDVKNDIMSGLYGKAVRLKTYATGPRMHSYYKRNNWAGKIRTADGAWILDSPANNANAHYLHNMFYILGDTIDSSVRPVDVKAELFRANNIENYDTVAMRVKVESGAEILFYATHAVSKSVGPLYKYEFENGVIEFGFNDVMVGNFTDGSVKKYADYKDGGMVKLWDSIKAVNGDGKVVCGIDAALSHLYSIYEAQKRESEIVVFPENMIVVDKNIGTDGNDTLTWVPELQENMFECFNDNILPSESDNGLFSEKIRFI